jgi:hypothetical protein
MSLMLCDVNCSGGRVAQVESKGDSHWIRTVCQIAVSEREQGLSCSTGVGQGLNTRHRKGRMLQNIAYLRASVNYCMLYKICSHNSISTILKNILKEMYRY